MVNWDIFRPIHRVHLNLNASLLYSHTLDTAATFYARKLPVSTLTLVQIVRNWETIYRMVFINYVYLYTSFYLHVVRTLHGNHTGNFQEYSHSCIRNHPCSHCTHQYLRNRRQTTFSARNFNRLFPHNSFTRLP